MEVSLIWAMSRNRVIGKDNGLPWRLPKDMKHFMASTMGKPVIMGRKTFESMGSPLPGRANIVLTRDKNWSRENVEVVSTLGEAVELADEIAHEAGQGEVFVIGGSSVYAKALPVATRLYVTLIESDIEGDVYFPEFDWGDWVESQKTVHVQDERHAYDFTISEFIRKI